MLSLRTGIIIFLCSEDRSNGTQCGGSAIYVHKSLKVERLDWLGTTRLV